MSGVDWHEKGMNWALSESLVSGRSDQWTADDVARAFAAGAAAGSSDDWKSIAEHAAREASALRENARRYEWLRERLLGADFDYEGAQVLVFEMPDGAVICADCDATIDDAMAIQLES